MNYEILNSIKQGLVSGLGRLIRCGVVLGVFLFLVWLFGPSGNEVAVKDATKLVDATLDQLVIHVAVGWGIAYFLVRLMLDDLAEDDK